MAPLLSKRFRKLCANARSRFFARLHHQHSPPPVAIRENSGHRRHQPGKFTFSKPLRILHQHPPQTTVFLGPEGRKFLSHLLGHFPYTHSGARTKRSKNVLEHNNDPKCVRENLLICFLYLMLHVNCTQKSLDKEMAIIMPYLKSETF